MAESQNLILAVRGISKSFPGVHALENVDFNLRQGEIHALVGENGAGKSTLIKVLTGVEQPDTGTITYDGKPVKISSPEHAQAVGISTVYQEVNLCPNLTVAENIFIGRAPRRLGGIDWGKMNAQAKQALQRLEIDIDVAQPLESYSIAIQQMTAIARALEGSSVRVLILDEPTSSLDARETAQLFRVMKNLKGRGVGIVFITHFIDQLYQVSDCITVLRNGRLVGTYETSTLPRLELIAKMIGRTLTEYDEMAKIKLESSRDTQAPTLLQAHELGHSSTIAPFDLEMRQGEVVGLAGLLGSGRTEIAELLFGIETPDSGTLTVNGKPVLDYSPLDSIKRGVALCPEDRKAEGIVDELTVRENIVLALQASRGWFRYLTLQEQNKIADEYIRLLNIATPSADQLVRNLSGGNQQKVILARWLATNPDVLILDEPTRGVDVGAKAEIQKLVLSLAEQGKACLFISSELDEVLRTSHRIVVLREREKVGEFSGEIDEKALMRTMAGGAT